MAANKGLGKGLAALFAEMERESAAAETEEVSFEAKSTAEVDINLIDSNPAQPRRTFDQDSLEELASSIRAHGVLQPILLIKNGSRYIVVAGERRLRAAKLADIRTIPAVIKELSDREQKEIALIENLQRENLNAMEEAEALRTLMDDYKLTQEELAVTIGKNRSTLANTLRLMNLSAAVQALVRAGSLSSGHARCLVVLSDSSLQLKLAEQAINAGLSVRELEQLVQATLAADGARTPRTRQKLDPTRKAFIYEMQRTLGTKVRMQGDENKGKITIEYHSDEEARRIMDILRKVN